MKDVLTLENLQKVADKFNFSNEEDMYAAVGYNGITALQVANRLTEKNGSCVTRKSRKNRSGSHFRAETLSSREKTGSGCARKGIDNLLVRLSKCCNPVPGDHIVGFITKGRGVSVHRDDCPNVKTNEAQERLIPVEWEHESQVQRRKEYNVEIEILGYDRLGLLNEVLQAVNETKPTSPLSPANPTAIKSLRFIWRFLFKTSIICTKWSSGLNRSETSIQSGG